MSKVEEQFTTIGEEAAELVGERAAAVKCAPEEYRQGLRDILTTIKDRVTTDIQASEETG